MEEVFNPIRVYCNIARITALTESLATAVKLWSNNCPSALKQANSYEQEIKSKLEEIKSLMFPN